MIRRSIRLILRCAFVTAAPRSFRIMSDTEAASTSSSSSTKKTAGKSKGSGAAGKKPRAKPTHPKTSDMVNAAIKDLKERGGSSLYAIKKYISSNYKVDDEKMAPFIRKYLKSAVMSGSLVRTTGKGASGSFKLPAARAGTEKSAMKISKAKAPNPKSSPKSNKAKKPASPKKASAKKQSATPVQPSLKPKPASKAKVTAKTPTKKPKPPKLKKTTTTKAKSPKKAASKKK